MEPHAQNELLFRVIFFKGMCGFPLRLISCFISQELGSSCSKPFVTCQAVRDQETITKAYLSKMHVKWDCGEIASWVAAGLSPTYQSRVGVTSLMLSSTDCTAQWVVPDVLARKRHLW